MTWCISLFLNPLFCRLNNGFVLVVVGVLSRTSGCHTWMRKSLGGAFQRHVLDLLEIVRSHDMVYLIALESFVLQAHPWTCVVVAAGLRTGGCYNWMRNSLRGASVDAPSRTYWKLYVSMTWCFEFFLNPLLCRLTNGLVLSSLLDWGPVAAIIGCAKFAP